ncbi:hypothetical protein QM999_12080 [Pectobacterium cacticida]|uniref:hypothetical protein n=1 Tax=Pectobacterium cacticida TaxID=69221 RepID=UPI002FF02199
MPDKPLSDHKHHFKSIIQACTKYVRDLVLHQYNWQQRPLLSIKDAVAPVAQAAVQAVVMALQGMSGSLDILDGEKGFWRMIGSDRFAQEILTHSLGSRWYVDYGSLKTIQPVAGLSNAVDYEMAA